MGLFVSETLIVIAMTKYIVAPVPKDTFYTSEMTEGLLKMRTNWSV